MRITGRRSDGALYLQLGGGLACVVRGDHISPPVDASEVEPLGPWEPLAESDWRTTRNAQRQADRARVAPLASFALGDSPGHPFRGNQHSDGEGGGDDKGGGGGKATHNVYVDGKLHSEHATKKGAHAEGMAQRRAGKDGTVVFPSDSKWRPDAPKESGGEHAGMSAWERGEDVPRDQYGNEKRGGPDPEKVAGEKEAAAQEAMGQAVHQDLMKKDGESFADLDKRVMAASASAKDPMAKAQAGAMVRQGGGKSPAARSVAAVEKVGKQTHVSYGDSTTAMFDHGNNLTPSNRNPEFAGWKL